VCYNVVAQQLNGRYGYNGIVVSDFPLRLELLSDNLWILFAGVLKLDALIILLTE